MAQNIQTNKLLVYSLVFFSGFANLATEIIGPRLVASLFGSTTVIWAIIISVTLVGISVGYFLGGRVPRERVSQVFSIILILNAIWLLLISWFIWRLPAGLASVGYVSIGLISIFAFFPPAVLFSMTSPLVISRLSAEHPPQALSKMVGNIYALGTMGSVAGALAAAFILIPWVGLSASLKLFAIGCGLYAIPFLSPRMRLLSPALLLLVLLFPSASYPWEEQMGLKLLAEREGYYQTIRVFTDESTFIRMDLGPTFHAEMDLVEREPKFGYAADMVRLAGDVRGKKILIIGGAGHTQAHALEKRGAIVTEVEIDPFVIELSDRYFGAMQGEVIATDGRAYLEQVQREQFDLIFVDAFDGLASIPTQLTTLEFFEAVDRALKPGGRLLYNFIGVPSGPRSSSFKALTTTMGKVFAETRASRLDGELLMNVILVASQKALDIPGYLPAPRDGVVLTDDLNPVEFFFEQARADYYFH